MAMFNPFVPSFTEDPYPAYARLRADEPVHHSAALQAWILTSYEACEEVLRDPGRFSSDPRRAQGQLGETIRAQRSQFPLGEVPTVLNSDPPTHTRLRAIVSQAFTPRRVEGLGPHIEEIAEHLLHDVRPGEPFDVMTGFAQALPIIVIAELLGVEPTDRDLFKRWSTAIASTTNLMNSPEVLESARQATVELVDYLQRVLAEREKAPRDDLLSALLAAEAEGARLSRDELLAFAILLLLAGHETTTNLIGNAALALAQHPEQAEWLREDGDRVKTAVEELLRFDSPVQAVTRVVTEETRLGGRDLVTGDLLLVLVGAANRDPERFGDPNRLDLAREDGRHLSFGLGPHFCLGAPLARIEGAVALQALLRHFSELRVAEGGAQRSGTLALRGLSRLELMAQ